MAQTLRLLTLYALTVLALSSVDITYEWVSPIRPQEGPPINWYATAGLHSGAIGLDNHDTGPAAGLEVAVHAPQFMPLPVYAGGGPEGGGIFVSVWSIGFLGLAIHALLSRPPTRRGSDNGVRA